MCIIPSEKALAQAKRNILQHFVIVGYLKKYVEFLEVLEILLPDYFTGALDLYNHKTNEEKRVLHKTSIKYKVSEEAKLGLNKMPEILVRV